MEKNLVLLLLLTPFVGFLFNVFFEKSRKDSFCAIGTLAVVVSFLLVYFFIQINQNETTLFEFHCSIGSQVKTLNWKSDFLLINCQFYGYYL
jgi:NADH-quinone oxidoreductase subunit L